MTIEYISAEDERELNGLMQKLELKPDDVESLIDSIRSLRRRSEIKDGKFPRVDAGEDLILKKNEICHYSYPVQLAEMKRKSHFEGGSRGISVRIAKGMSYRVGGFKGERVTEEYIDITDEGQLYVTNKRVVFIGNKKTVTFALKSLSSVKSFGNGILFQRDNQAKPKYMMIDEENIVEEIDALVTTLIRSLE